LQAALFRARRDLISRRRTDIYSIEDLAQLIFDIKQINPTAWCR
jgi:glutamate synthase domain-containing protein 2